jgi:general secretion pathway protein D
MLKSTTRKSASIVGLAALMSASLMVSGCSFIASDSCADQANLPKSEIGWRGCEGGFFSARQLRETTYQGDDSARLWTGAELRRGPNVDPTRVNQPPAARTPIAGWTGSLRVEVAADESAVSKDIAEIKSAGATKFDPDEKVTVKFEKASLDFFLKQMLGGALGVSYIAPDDLSGSVTFRTEQPISKGQVLQVVRDVLGRNGLEMRYMNGVYQIAGPDQMASLQQTAAPGRASDQETRVLKLHKGKAIDVIRFVRQLLPEEITLVASNGGDSIVAKAPASELDRVAELVSLSDSSLGDDRVAIIPLMQSSPDKIAQQLSEFYRSQAEAATIVPLDNQQALLVGTRDRRALEGLKRLVRQLDRDTGGDSTLRIIPLVHLSADEIVLQLTQVYAGSGVGGGAAAAPAAAVQSGGNLDSSPQAARAPSLAPPVQVPRAVSGDDGGFSSPGFALPPGGANAGGSGNGPGNGNTAAAIASSIGALPVQAAVGSAVKFVADTRNNSVMIYSSYSMFKLVKDRLRVLDVPQAQVVIEATVAEVLLNDDLSRGVEAFLTSKGLNIGSSANGGITTTTQAGGFLHAQFGIQGATADIILRALQSVTNVKVISTPYLTVVDGKTARLVIGDQVPFSTTTQSTQLTGTTTVTQQITVKDTGIQLEVTPKIRSDNSTALNINQSVSAVKNTSTASSLTPTISTRSVKSDIIVQSGSTIMLAGLVQEGSNKTETGIPVARSIPIVGELFKQNEDIASRQELIVLITPRVIRNSSQIENITRQMRGMMHIRG